MSQYYFDKKNSQFEINEVNAILYFDSLSTLTFSICKYFLFPFLFLKLADSEISHDARPPISQQTISKPYVASLLNINVGMKRKKRSMLSKSTKNNGNFSLISNAKIIRLQSVLARQKH